MRLSGFVFSGGFGFERALIGFVKQLPRIFDWAVITALSTLIVATLVHAATQLPH